MTVHFTTAFNQNPPRHLVAPCVFFHLFQVFFAFCGKIKWISNWTRLVNAVYIADWATGSWSNALQSSSNRGPQKRRMPFQNSLLNATKQAIKMSHRSAEKQQKNGPFSFKRMRGKLWTELFDRTNDSCNPALSTMEQSWIQLAMEASRSRSTRGQSSNPALSKQHFQL